MCGRFHRELSWRQVHEFLDLRFPTTLEDGADVPPSSNVAPTHFTPVCTLKDGVERAIGMMHWGIVPPWSRDGRMLINARSETAPTGPGFREAWTTRRCIVPATGFYEWKQEGTRKVPMLFTVPDEPIFAFAGLWEPERSTKPAGVVILTMAPNELVASVHDRMPVMLRRGDIKQWLQDGQGDFLRAPIPAEEMRMSPAAGDLNTAPARRKAPPKEDSQPGLFG
ncbi:MAG: SOS response-associated peptidase [Phycisphaerales bacterium]